MTVQIVKTISWQPIASAPKEGLRPILVWSPGLRVARPVMWSGWGGGCWACATSGHNGVATDATHWMPMLEGPET